MLLKCSSCRYRQYIASFEHFFSTCLLTSQSHLKPCWWSFVECLFLFHGPQRSFGRKQGTKNMQRKWENVCGGWVGVSTRERNRWQGNRIKSVGAAKEYKMEELVASMIFLLLFSSNISECIVMSADDIANGRLAESRLHICFSGQTIKKM